MPNVLSITCDASKLDAQLSQAEARVKSARSAMQSAGAGGSSGAASAAQAVTDAGNAAKTAGEKIATASNAVSALGATMGVSVPPVGAFGSLIKSLANPIGLVTVAVVGLAAAIIQHLQRAMQDQRDTAEANLRNIQETARAHEELRTKTNGYLDTLQGLASKEKLSNAEKAKAIKTVRDLTAAYGDLGISIDATAGSITGLDAAMVKKLANDKKQQISDLKNEREAMMQRRDRWQEYIDDWKTLSPEAIRNAADKRDESVTRMAQIDAQIRTLERSDPVRDYEERRRAENDDRQQTVFDARRRNRATAEDMAADTKAKQLTLYESRLAASEAKQRELAAAAKDRYDSSTGEHWEDFRSRQIAAEKALEEEKAKGLELEQRVLALRKEVAAEEKEKQRQELGQSADFYKNYLGQVYANTGTVTNSLTARGGFASGARSHDPDRVQREILNCNRQLQRHTEAIARLLGEN